MQNFFFKLSIEASNHLQSPSKNINKILLCYCVFTLDWIWFLVWVKWSPSPGTRTRPVGWESLDSRQQQQFSNSSLISGWKEDSLMKNVVDDVFDGFLSLNCKKMGTRVTKGESNLLLENVTWQNIYSKYFDFALSKIY